MTTLSSYVGEQKDQTAAAAGTQPVPPAPQREAEMERIDLPELQPFVPPKPPQPAIHVHTLSDPTSKDEFECLLRPVIAEQYQRHIPKDDLLTPRDVAKAFQLEFGLQTEQSDRYFDQPGISRRFKVLITGVVALGVAVVFAWPMVRGALGWTDSTEIATVQSPQPASTLNTLLADARPASDQIPAFRPQAFDASAPAFHDPAFHDPAVHPAASSDPIIVADPTATDSPEDDPNVLWSTGQDAESAGNYTKAVEAYERIESLPSYLWPANLESKLARVRKQLSLKP